MSEAERLDEAAWRAGLEAALLAAAARRAGGEVAAGAETPSGWRVVGRLELLEREGGDELWALAAPAGGPLAFVSAPRRGGGSPLVWSPGEVERLIADRRAEAARVVAFLRAVATSGAPGRVRPAASLEVDAGRLARAARAWGDQW